jgi:hypothetical protein
MIYTLDSKICKTIHEMTHVWCTLNMLNKFIGNQRIDFKFKWKQLIIAEYRSQLISYFFIILNLILAAVTLWLFCVFFSWDEFGYDMMWDLSLAYCLLVVDNDAWNKRVFLFVQSSGSKCKKGNEEAKKRRKIK